MEYSSRDNERCTVATRLARDSSVQSGRKQAQSRVCTPGFRPISGTALITGHAICVNGHVSIGKFGYFVTQMLLQGNGSAKPVDKYTYLENDIDRSNRQFIDDTNAQQQVLLFWKSGRLLHDFYIFCIAVTRYF